MKKRKIIKTDSPFSTIANLDFLNAEVWNRVSEVRTCLPISSSFRCFSVSPPFALSFSLAHKQKFSLAHSFSSSYIYYLIYLDSRRCDVIH